MIRICHSIRRQSYNEDSELISASELEGRASMPVVTEYAYQYDDIGNRITSLDLGTNRVYSANELNQYSAITTLTSDVGLQTSSFTPQFDLDGNQTLIKTSTGIWSVTYNGENRPILWECVSPNSPTPNSSTPTLLSMSYDRMGRRVTKNNQRFIYDGYLQIANFELATSNFEVQTFIWDPTEPVATRPLMWKSGASRTYYVHDGNKNVSEVVSYDGALAAHYEYAPFGAITTQCGIFATANPWRFSSEYAEVDTTTVCYNFRYIEAEMGRWLSRDCFGEHGGVGLYAFISNSAAGIDRLGLDKVSTNGAEHNPRVTAERMPSKPEELVLYVKPENIQEGCELNFIQLVREFELDNKSGTWMSTGWKVDAKISSKNRATGAPDPVPPYYYDFSNKTTRSAYLLPDGRVKFEDHPNDGVPMEFYLFSVQRCCLEYYGGSKECKCCKKSRATILGYVHWKTSNDSKDKYINPTIVEKKNDDKGYVRYLLGEHINGKEFTVYGCEEYQKNHKNDGMPATAELDFGGKL